MGEVSEELYNSLIRYYNRLGNVGIVFEKSVNNLLAFIWIQEMLEGPLSQFITDKDYHIIMGALSCLYNTDCIIGSIPTKCIDRAFIDEEINGGEAEYPRDTEWEALRYSGDTLRKKVTR